MRLVGIFVPHAAPTATLCVTFTKRGTYRVTAPIPEGNGWWHSHAVTLREDASREDVASAWRKCAKDCERCHAEKHPEERHKPTTEPFLAEWLALHKQHLKALRDGKKDPLRLCDAVKLADAKYAVYRREHAARLPMFATSDFAAHRRETGSTARGVARALRGSGIKANARKGVVRVTAEGKAK